MTNNTRKRRDDDIRKSREYRVWRKMNTGEFTRADCWDDFDVFNQWLAAQDYADKVLTCKVFDRNNEHYSPETTFFISCSLSRVLIGYPKVTSDGLIIGVETFAGDRFQSQITVNSQTKRKVHNTLASAIKRRVGHWSKVVRVATANINNPRLTIAINEMLADSISKVMRTIAEQDKTIPKELSSQSSFAKWAFLYQPWVTKPVTRA